MLPNAPPAEPAPARTPRVVGVGLGLSVAVGVACSASIASGGQVLARRWSLLVVLGAWGVAWIAGVACALRTRGRLALAAIFIAAVLLRLAALAGPPALSDDLYRYAWDGRVQAAGVDPYGHVPASHVVARLREPWLWPDDVGCARLHRPSGCTRINRPAVRTIYPPVAEGWFAVVYRVFGIEARHKAWQIAGFVSELGVVALIAHALGARGRDRRWVALYALSPAPVVEVVNNGHVDGLAALFIVAALILVARRRAVWAGAAIGAAVLVKLYPVVLLAGLAKRSRRRSPLVRASATTAAVVAVGYLPHVLAVGARVVGYLPGYLREEHYDGAGRFLLVGLLGLPSKAATVVAVAALTSAVMFVLVRRIEAPQAFVIVIGAILLIATPVQPWYAVTLVAVAAVAVRPVWALVAAAGYPYFFAVILDARHAVAIGRLSFGLALVGIVAVQAARQRRVRPCTVVPA